ncbi:hypothetical protein [Bacillus paramycoides]|uniref:hypothetical protein n=1 Tax=Bacillus paramycoides TaxID=2026194 RepID=UPI003D028661
MAEFHFTLSAEKSRLILPKNVLAWVLCHLVGGTPYIKRYQEKGHVEWKKIIFPFSKGLKNFLL